MVKETEKMLDHILFMARHFQVNDAKYIVMIILLELGFEPKYDGYHYLVRAIVLYLQAPSQITVKNLYAAVAALYNGSVDADLVEQGIRSAIKKAWNKSNVNWSFYFQENERPSNGNFISMIACVIELWKGWCEDYKTSLHTEEVKL